MRISVDRVERHGLRIVEIVAVNEELRPGIKITDSSPSSLVRGRLGLR